MSEREPNFSRISRKKEKNRTNTILNILIGVVVVLIVVTASVIFFGDSASDTAKENESSLQNSEKNDENQNEEESIDEPDKETDESQSGKSLSEQTNGTDDLVHASEKQDSVDADTEKTEENSSGSVTYLPSDDEIVKETVINTSWKPIGTKQTGEHVSKYDGTSADWNEKKQAIAYTVGIAEDDLIYWKIKNGGGPQKSIGIVSTKDKKEKYQVHLEWIEGEGWKPVQMDVLKTLDFTH